MHLEKLTWPQHWAASLLAIKVKVKDAAAAAAGDDVDDDDDSLMMCRPGSCLVVYTRTTLLVHCIDATSSTVEVYFTSTSSTLRQMFTSMPRA